MTYHIYKLITVTLEIQNRYAQIHEFGSIYQKKNCFIVLS
jgi:hypothetical protein